jgi:hypothetical protein
MRVNQLHGELKMADKKPYYVLFKHSHGQGAFDNEVSDYDLKEVQKEAEFFRGESEFPLYILTIDAGANHFDAMVAADDFFQLISITSYPKYSPKKKELYKFPNDELDAIGSPIGARLNRVRYGRFYS